jgi:hypothetical protein
MYSTQSDGGEKFVVSAETKQPVSFNSADEANRAAQTLLEEVRNHEGGGLFFDVVEVYGGAEADAIVRATVVEMNSIV